MKTLIVFSSKYGTTKSCGELVKKGLKNEADIVNLKDNYSISLNEYDLVIIGGSVYAGRIQKKVVKFMENNKEELGNKKIGLFVCCKEEGEKALEYIKANYPEWIINKALVKEHFGHEVNLEKMGLLDKIILKVVAKATKSYSDIKTDNIEGFINTINRLDGTVE
ncbi:flavodoxin domain-containing protein [Wukongibacter baidiensis]|uniref:flavodoxin domain-containing protein n=1 Tax=Wukongibacter baidiensis TaxID=1723361 RepID=UPI003D7FEDB8